MRSNCIYYLLTQGLSELLSEEEKVEIASKDTHGYRYINKKINDEPMNSLNVKT
jgi:serine/threonine protein phosphatase PrpC